MIKVILIILLLMAINVLLASAEEVTREEVKILQWHLSESQAMETDGMPCNPVDNGMEICVRVRKPETTYWMDTKTFADTVVGVRRGKYFYLYNRGDKDLVCNKPILTGPFTSSFQGDKRAVTPGNKLSFIVYFTPPAAGEYSTVMRLICNDYSKPQEFLLTGKGI